MFIKILKINFTSYIFLIAIMFLFFSKPSISSSYGKYEVWLENSLIEKLNDVYDSKFLMKIIKIGKLSKNEFTKINKIVNNIYDRDFINPELYFDIKKINRISKAAINLSKIHNSKLLKIEKKFGVPKSIILAIWATESTFGKAKLEFLSLKAIIFHIYNGKRRNYYLNELHNILRIIKSNKIDLKKILGSSYGAMGQPQFMPSSYNKYGFDFDNDGKVDIWNDEGDTLASIANFLSSNGWEKNLLWGLEVKKKFKSPCYLEGPDIKKTINEWKLSGFEIINRNSDRFLPSSILTSLLLPKGEYGPKFLVTKNFYVLKRYNFSDFYALYVSILANLIDGEKFFKSKWESTVKVNFEDIYRIQKNLSKLGFKIGKIDGLIGFKTRRSIGKYQKTIGQQITCYPNGKF